MITLIMTRHMVYSVSSGTLVDRQRFCSLGPLEHAWKRVPSEWLVEWARICDQVVLARNVESA